MTNFKPSQNFTVASKTNKLSIANLRDELRYRCIIINRIAILAALMAAVLSTLAIGINNFDPSAAQIMTGGPTVTAQVTEIFSDSMEQSVHRGKRKPEPHLIHYWEPFLVVMILLTSCTIGFCIARYFALTPRISIPVMLVVSWIFFLPLPYPEHHTVKWSDLSIEQFDTLDAMRPQPKNPSARPISISSDQVPYTDQQYLAEMATLDQSSSTDLTRTQRAQQLIARNEALIALHNRDELIRAELRWEEGELPRDNKFLDEIIPLRQAADQTNTNLPVVECAPINTHRMYLIRQKINGGCALIIHLNRMGGNRADMMRFAFAQRAYYNDDPATVGYYLSGMTGNISELMSAKAWYLLNHEYRLRFSVLVDYARRYDSSLDLKTAEEIAAGPLEFQARRAVRWVILFFAGLAAGTAALFWCNWYLRKQTLDSLTERLSPTR